MKKNYIEKNQLKTPDFLKNTILLILFFFGVNTAFGQGAACSSATAVNVNQDYTGFTISDTTVNDPTPAACNGQNPQRDGWFSFVANGTEASIYVTASNRNPILYAYSGGCGSLSFLNCANATTSTSGHTEVLPLSGLTSGLTYYVRVGNSTNNNMALSSFVVITNDKCSGAITLTSNTSCVTTTGSTSGATDNNEVGDCTTGTENSVWYQFQAVATTHVVTVTGISGFDTVLNVISACGSATAPAGASCVDNTGSAGTETLTLTGLTIGNYYKIQVHDFQGDLTANGFTICVTHTPTPTMTSLSAASGCVGTSLTITGTNLSSASSVTIGGTAATITANTATSITVTVGSGTTGTVSVTTAGGTATSASTPTPTFTVNPLPANPANPTSNSPQCNPPGVTITRAASPPAGENYYWQTVSLGTATGSSGATYTATASGTYYIRSQNTTTGCWSSGQGSLAVVVDTAISTLATSPSPSTSATGVCYGGSGAISSVSWTAAAGATSYDVYFGAGSLPGSVTSNVLTTSYNTGTLLASTTYYWKIVPRNACGVSSGSAITWTFTTAAAPCSCTPTGNLDCTLSDYISNVTFNGLNNTTTCGSGGYTVYPASGAQTTTLMTGQAYTFSLSVGSGFGTHGAAVWIDFNQNGVFTDAGEYFLISNAIAASSTTTVSITIPAGATLGAVKMRVRYAYNVTVASTMSCTMSGTYGETEDYTVTLIAPVACTTPTAQPTSLNLSSVTSTSIGGSFTAASPAPSGYLIVRSSSATPPTPVNGTTYAVGSTALGAGTVVVQGSAVTSTATSFSDTGLTSNTKYYYYIFSYNNTCTGAPFYLTTSPLTNNATTCAAAPTSAVNSGISTSAFTVSWTASVVGGGAGTINYTLEVYTNAGYTTPISGSPFSLGTALTYSLSGLTSGTTYYYRIKANNGSCDSSYLTGSATTLVTNNQCSSAISLPCGTSNMAGTTIGTSSFTHGTGCTMSNYGVWYTFVGDGNQNQISVTTTSFDVEMSISRGSCGSLTNVTCQDVAFSSGTEVYTFATTSGMTYFVYVADYANSGTTTGNFTISRACIPPMTNDECSGAIALTVSSTCNYSTYSSIGATASAGVTAPGCASYSTGDVWFSAVVPSTGELDVDMLEGSLTDSGMAFYSGSCGSLTLLECDNDDSSNGYMSYISMTGLTPGQTIYIRVWDYFDGTGSFGICASTPSCPSPSDLLATITSATSVVVSWNNTTPPASGGYQYYISTSNTPPTNSTPPTGSTAAGVNAVSLTGLTSGQKYYFWVRSYCGGSDVSTWFGPTNYTPCAIGNGTGTTTNQCPSVTAGGLGLNGADPVAMDCSALTCTTLEATYLTVNQPTNYSVSSIPYNPPYQFTCLQNPVSVNIDDVWSPVISLPFNFCYYGTNYNKVLMGSNGVISFNTSGTGYTPGGYNAWSFSNNLPSTNLFLNTIFGVYHDIDPSKGGQVGWELITLNTGCRALVASWNDIPMYSSTCNSQLYTGMIVLYENTNVIEVYIKEKNVCGTWNSGNAIVGLQNAAGNAAVVAPNRNGLDADWTTSSEAWRFTPTGSSLTSIKWFEGFGTTGTLLGTTSNISVCPTVTTTYTAEVTYALCSGTNLKYTDNVQVTINGNKIWNGSQNQDWNTANNWTPSGAPTSANCVIIPVTPNNPVISNTPDGVGYNLLVYNGAQLTINSSKNLTITDKVTVQPTGMFTLNNSASLVQINNIANSGNITYNRTAQNIRTLDYVYWASPVANFNISSIVSPYSFGPIYTWNTTVANSNGGQGTWQNFSGSMVTGKGYIARSPGTSPFNNSSYNPLNGTFTGVPNNGNINVAIERGNDQNTATHYGTNGIEITNLSDNWNLLGNPYPSALRGSQFLFDNNTKILGNIRLWTHGNLPVYTTNPFYSSFVYNYTSGDYLTYNFTGTSCCPAAGSDLFIGSGQGFFVQMIDGAQTLAAANVTVGFNNNQRNASFDNSIFYRNAIPTVASLTQSSNLTNLERNRIWLDLISPNGQSDRTLFGYIENATMDTDSFFDCITQNVGGTLIFSETGQTKFNIQGRALPFDVNDEVPIGINAPVAQGEYTIAIAAVDGLFNSQNIYLKDNLLSITHDLKASPYRFTTTQTGGISGRFKVVYRDSALGTPHFDENNIKVFVNNQVAVSSANLAMESIEVYNLLGQKLDQYKNINSDYVILSNLRKNDITLFLKIKMQTGEIVTKKIIY